MKDRHTLKGKENLTYKGDIKKEIQQLNVYLINVKQEN